MQTNSKQTLRGYDGYGNVNLSALPEGVVVDYNFLMELIAHNMNIKLGGKQTIERFINEWTARIQEEPNPHMKHGSLKQLTQFLDVYFLNERRMLEQSVKSNGQTAKV